jgi:allophanate hydrolase subunit 1
MDEKQLKACLAEALEQVMGKVENLNKEVESLTVAFAEEREARKKEEQEKAELAEKLAKEQEEKRKAEGDIYYDEDGKEIDPKVAKLMPRRETT